MFRRVQAEQLNRLPNHQALMRTSLCGAARKTGTHEGCQLSKGAQMLILGEFGFSLPESRQLNVHRHVGPFKLFITNLLVVRLHRHEEDLCRWKCLDYLRGNGAPLKQILPGGRVTGRNRQYDPRRVIQ